MRSTLEAFLSIIEELRVFANSIEPVNSALARNKNTAVQKCLNVRRRLDYAAFVVALYAAFEKFVEDLAWSHTELNVSRNKYAELPKMLREKHLRDSAEILTRSNLGEGRYAGITPSDIVNNLHACLSGNETYKLNRHAIIHHDGNLRSEVVQGIFTSLGIEKINTLARQAEPMLIWFSEVEGRNRASVGEIPEKLIHLRIEDLVGRRNQVSHSGGDLAESFAPEEMRERLAFVEAYSRSLFIILAGAYLERYYLKSGTAKVLGRPIEGPFKNGAVVVRKPSYRVYVGQAIFGVRKGLVDRWGEVMEIRVDDVPVNSIESESPATGVGLRADFKLTKGTQLYVLEKKDEVVWG